MSYEATGSFAHCKNGYELLKKCPHTKKFALTVLHHHDRWAGPNESGLRQSDIPLHSRIICLADRTDVLIHPKEYILHQKYDIIKTIQNDSGAYFDPQVVEAFNRLAERESFWLDITSLGREGLLSCYKPTDIVNLNYGELEGIAGLLAHIVDSKSVFTLQHSKRVSRVAEALAKRSKFSPLECEVMKIAGLLHDLGKLSIPDEILDKPDKLTRDEYEIIKRHVYYTHVILGKIKGFETINKWASLHHERLDGRGYPFHVKEDVFPLGSRIMAVSDVFTAIAEDRPYRKGYPPEKICEVLNKCVSEKALDGDIVKIVTENINEFCKLLVVE